MFRLFKESQFSLKFLFEKLIFVEKLPFLDSLTRLFFGIKINFELNFKKIGIL